MAINWPGWVMDWTVIPAGVNVRAKQMLYALAALEKLRRLHNAGWKWYRGEVLTAEEQALLQAAFPGQWPTPPTEQQVQQWLTNWWEPRQDAICEWLGAARQAVAGLELNWVNLNTLVS